MAGLILKGVKKEYPGGFVAVQDFDLEIFDTEFLVLVGPSGCGKTSTLRMIAGLEEISEGNLYIGDKHMNDIPPKDRDIAMVFQSYALYPQMTAYNNMAFGLKMRKTPKDEIDRRVKEAAKILSIEHLLNKRPKTLSGGERQRVAMGRAIVREPQVFLMDEPLSNLDAKLRMQMRAEISKLHKRLKTTVVYVTHDQVEAMTLGTRIVVMNHGFIQQVDTPVGLYENPKNLFVAGFIGSPHMNFVEVIPIEQDDDVFMAFGEHKIKLPREKAQGLVEQDYIGKTVIMGIRPEHIHTNADFIVAHPEAAINAVVELTEYHGAEVYLHIKIADSMAIAKAGRQRTVAAGENIGLAMDTSKIHIFDKDTEMSINSQRGHSDE